MDIDFDRESPFQPGTPVSPDRFIGALILLIKFFDMLTQL